MSIIAAESTNINAVFNTVLKKVSCSSLSSGTSFLDLSIEI